MELSRRGMKVGLNGSFIHMNYIVQTEVLYARSVGVNILPFWVVNSQRGFKKFVGGLEIS
jgi:hypothetical protein